MPVVSVDERADPKSVIKVPLCQPRADRRAWRVALSGARRALAARRDCGVGSRRHARDSTRIRRRPHRRAARADFQAPAIHGAQTSTSPSAAASDIRIDAAALRARLEKLSEFGRPAGGVFADGVSRVAYSDADIAGRTYVIGLMRAAGLEPRIDPAGNIFARRDGLEPALPPILFGSHIDSVPRGGNFDGDLGSLAALAVDRDARARRHPHASSARDRRLVRRGRRRVRTRPRRQPDRGGRHHARRSRSDLERHDAAPKRSAASAAAPSASRMRVRPKGSHHCYLELHIEQGGTLERQHHRDRRRRRHRRDPALSRGDHRPRESCRDDADGRTAGCADRGVAPDARGARDCHGARRAGRSAPSVISTWSPTPPT